MDVLAFLDLLKEAPAWVLAGYLVWRHTQQENMVLTAFREGAENNRQLAEALQTLQRLERFHEATATKLLELQAEIRSMRQ